MAPVVLHRLAQSVRDVDSRMPRTAAGISFQHFWQNPTSKNNQEATKMDQANQEPLNVMMTFNLTVLSMRRFCASIPHQEEARRGRGRKRGSTNHHLPLPHVFRCMVCHPGKINDRTTKSALRSWVRSACPYPRPSEQNQTRHALLETSRLPFAFSQGSLIVDSTSLAPRPRHLVRQAREVRIESSRVESRLRRTSPSTLTATTLRRNASSSAPNLTSARHRLIIARHVHGLNPSRLHRCGTFPRALIIQPRGTVLQNDRLGVQLQLLSGICGRQTPTPPKSKTLGNLGRCAATERRSRGSLGPSWTPHHPISCTRCTLWVTVLQSRQFESQWSVVMHLLQPFPSQPRTQGA